MFSKKKHLLYLFFLLFPILSFSHPLKPSIFTIEFKKDGTFKLEVQTNMEVLLAGIKPIHKDTNDSPQFLKYNKLRELSPSKLEKQAKEFEPNFRKALNMSFDSKNVELEFKKFIIPDVGDLKVARKSSIIYSGIIPEKATQAVFDFDIRYGSSVTHFKIEGDKNKLTYWNAYSSKSPAFKLDERVQPKSLYDITLDYIVLGFEHIIPKGIDHILFVVGLFLLVQHWKPLLWQVTAFTLAHTVTLALTILGYISLSPSIIEPLIALSIVYIAIENIFTNTLHNWRIIIVFLFGLLHGMGFASVLMDIGLPQYALTTALISFNIGVEFGQLAVLALAFIATFYFLKHQLFRKVVVIPISLLISMIGLYWFIERIGLI